MPMVGKTLREIERCPQCGVARPTLNYQHHFWDHTRVGDLIPTWFTYMCASCGNLVAALALLTRHDVQDQNLVIIRLTNQNSPAIQILPEERTVDADIPERPRKYLSQAINSLSAPDGAVMLAGSAVDAMLKIKGYSDGSVYARINQAVTDHVLTKEMGEWAHAVRLEANKPRHADADDPHSSDSEAQQSIQFAQALGEYLFALPARVERGKKASGGSADLMPP